MSVFPVFEIFLENGGKLYSVKGSSLSYQLGYGQTSAYTLTANGDAALELEATLTEGSVLKEIYAGYRDTRLELLARNIVIWETDFGVDASSGLSFSAYGYGCSQFLRNSGQRTERLIASSYANAVREVCARWGLKVTIAEGASVQIENSSELFSQEPDGLPALGSPEETSEGNLKVLTSAMAVARGERIPRLSDDTVNEPGWCAQLVRQVVEHGLGIAPFSWPVAVEAGKLAPNDGDAIQARTANNYARACQLMGLSQPGPQRPPQPGDIVFNETTALPFGHVAIYLGEINGIPSILENASSDRGTPPLGYGRIRVSPLSAMGTITTVARAVPLTESEKPVTETQPSIVAKTDEVTATAKPNLVNLEKRMIAQEDESDWDFLGRLGREIGYIISENYLGDELVFSPGLAVGSRPRNLLVMGNYQVNGNVIPANLQRVNSRRSFYNIPSEVIVTGVEKNGERFSLILTANDLAERQKVALEKLAKERQNALQTAFAESAETKASEETKVVAKLTDGGTATPKAELLELPEKTPESETASDLEFSDLAANQVGVILGSLYPGSKRLVLGGSSSKLEAEARGLEALALESLRFQEVSCDLAGLPELQLGSEAILQGSLLPSTLTGLYVVLSINGEIGENGYSMSLKLNRNTTQ
jgi:cell wall-associated NlpC family hydrolase